MPSAQGKEWIKRFSRPRNILLFGITLGILVFVACGGGGSQSAPPVVRNGAESPTASLAPAPDFEFSFYQGEGILGAGARRLSDLRGKPLVLNFWAGLCPPCRAEMPDLQKFYNEFGDRVNLFGLDIGPFVGLGSRQDGKDLLKELNVTYPAGTTFDDKVARNYNVLGMPSTYFITTDGKLFRKWTGLLTKSKLTELTEKMLALPQPTPGEAGSASGSSK